MGISDEITAIEAMDVDGLRALWRQTRHMDPPESLSARLMQNTLIYELQAKRYGGLSQKIERKLARLAAKLAKDQNACLLANEKPAPGTKIIREWGGERHEVQVLGEGFAYRGAVYGSLSEIARLITGAHWSGPRFFGLKNRRKAA